MEQIAIIIPTRSRVDNLLRLSESWKTCTSGKSIIVPVIDGDQLHEYFSSIKANDWNWFPSDPKKEATLTNKLNYAAEVIALNYPIIAFMGDDFVFRTPGWEDKIIEWQMENKGICYCNDLLQGVNLPTAPFMHSDLIKAMGYMAPPALNHYYIDNFWIDLGNKIGRIKYFPEIVIEHMHWSAKKSSVDEIYSSTENKFFTKDRETWDEHREEMISSSEKFIKNYDSDRTTQLHSSEHDS